jgi:hypothetical protein
MVKSTSMWLFPFAREIYTHYSFGVDGTAISPSNSVGSPKGALSVASIAGISFGIAVVVLALLFVLFILYRRRRLFNKHRNDATPISTASVPTSAIVPFLLQTSAAAHHDGGTGLYTPVRESFKFLADVSHPILTE